MPIDNDGANLFFQLISSRYEKSSTIITTNVVFSEWGEIFGGATIANAILDRLLHHSYVIFIKGPSYRLQSKTAYFSNIKPAKLSLFFVHFYFRFFVHFDIDIYRMQRT